MQGLDYEVTIWTFVFTPVATQILYRTHIERIELIHHVPAMSLCGLRILFVVQSGELMCRYPFVDLAHGIANGPPRLCNTSTRFDNRNNLIVHIKNSHGYSKFVTGVTKGRKPEQVHRTLITFYTSFIREIGYPLRPTQLLTHQTRRPLMSREISKHGLLSSHHFSALAHHTAMIQPRHPSISHLFLHT